MDGAMRIVGVILSLLLEVYLPLLVFFVDVRSLVAILCDTDESVIELDLLKIGMAYINVL